jgi:cytoskeletal protein CcmA (bactofilin family)
MSDEKFDTVIGEDIVFRGLVKFENTLRIRGHLKGSIESNGDLVIEPGGNVEADILVNSLVVQGQLKGNIEARDKVEIGKTGVVIGDIKTSQLGIEVGAKFTGSCAM